MADISFIYRINDDTNVYYGKVCYSYPQIYDNLNLEAEKILLFGLNKYRTQQDLPLLKASDIIVGIISFSSIGCNLDIFKEFNNSTEKEIKCFDFYYTKYRDQTKQDQLENFYIKGTKIILDQPTTLNSEGKYKYAILEIEDIEN